MKQSKNISLATKTLRIFPLKLLSSLLIFIVLSGGASFAAERQKYKVIVTRPGKNVTTQLRVYAEDEEEARENVALNGWQILSIEAYGAPADGQMRGMEAGAGQFTIKVTKVGEGSVDPEGDVPVTAGDSLMLTLKPGPCEKAAALIYNGDKVDFSGDSYTLDNVSADGNVVAVFEKNGTQCGDNGIFSADLSELGAVYFALGKFEKVLTDEEKATIAKVIADKNYVIIGHTDDVKVKPNSEYADNFQLSVKRAQFILSKLEEMGINTENIKTVGLGPAFPAAPNKKEGQPKNRRAIIYERTTR